MQLLAVTNFLILQAQMKGAPEVLDVILECLHQSFTPGCGVFLMLNQKLAWGCITEYCNEIFGLGEVK